MRVIFILEIDSDVIAHGNEPITLGVRRKVKSSVKPVPECDDAMNRIATLVMAHVDDCHRSIPNSTAG